jgi:hypothetical protein
MGDLRWDPTLVDTEEDEILPADLSLKQNYPNPFNPCTKIEFSISERSHVKIEVYDLLGEVVDILLDDYKEKGSYTLNWNPENLSSGIYFYRMISNQNLFTRKMIYTK